MTVCFKADIKIGNVYVKEELKNCMLSFLVYLELENETECVNLIDSEFLK